MSTEALVAHLEVRQATEQVQEVDPDQIDLN
jgi:hypothetical protein